jgi:hypothetical protein
MLGADAIWERIPSATICADNQLSSINAHPWGVYGTRSANGISRLLHFQRLTVFENDGTSLYHMSFRPLWTETHVAASSYQIWCMQADRLDRSSHPSSVIGLLQYGFSVLFAWSRGVGWLVAGVSQSSPGGFVLKKLYKL